MNATSTPFLTFANLIMAATPALALAISYLTTAH